ncbi:30S ribosomal protein S8 [Candidatus Woesearchaeota archaeon CG08_land_8_20_14_0_20_47_9]|nr:MAG: 30S ribosomal protein S8 [Candidatus Woesearchaeota archaeon CG1_02_47_18]PIN73809.1 MAG: 30S ribosomal protein S8 [Candidatus Woesearchaeota archaeon CG10_big_fil_rev_8_21_14_0_10_47_5]PIO04096.1 MAG: 30S ribosomal protein S8 [Candidatus Woesearchaeota archaeon CG08_land_8_20_14_0_20_47_9]HII29788.1 30S ribosomal protein S8 [Candidatus Woesearchaeota archaeon]
MALNDLLSNALSHILNSERSHKQECLVKSSKLIRGVLELLQAHHYIGGYSAVEDGRGGILRVNLLGQINRCGSIKPRFAVGKFGFERFEKSILPAKDFGILVVSTPQGLMTHTEAKKRNMGGKLIAYCY